MRTVIKSVKKYEWQDYAGQCQIHHIYQDPRWLELIETVYSGLCVHRLACIDGTGKFQWLLPLVEIKPLGKFRPMLISLPYANYGGFVFPKQESDSTEAISKEKIDNESIDLLKCHFQSLRADVLEIRETSPPAYDAHVYDEYQRFEINLPVNPKILWEKIISGNARTSVRKADKEHVEIVVNPENALDVFISLNERNAAFHGTPIHPAMWFSAMARLFASELCIIAAKHKNQYVGAAFMLNDGTRAILHALVPDPRFRHLYVSDKLVWECLKYLVENKSAQLFDFGRTRPDPGQIFFKRKWGGQAKPIYYAYLLKPGARIPQFKPDSPLFSAAGKIWQRLPLSFTRRVGPFLRKRISS